MRLCLSYSEVYPYKEVDEEIISKEIRFVLWGFHLNFKDECQAELNSKFNDFNYELGIICFAENPTHNLWTVYLYRFY